MSKSLLDLLWIEIKKQFYANNNHLSQEKVFDAWSKYQIELINDSKK